MDKKELVNLIKTLATHFGERVSCEWLSADGVDWTKWNNAEITTNFLVDLEKGYIRNIQLKLSYVTIRAELITTFDTFDDWLDQASSQLAGYRKEEIVHVDQNRKVLLSGQEFLFSQKNKLFPVQVYRMIRTID